MTAMARSTKRVGPPCVGIAEPDQTSTHCDPDPEDWVDNDEDCDDADPGVHPEIWDGCDGFDNDCDGIPDDDHRDGWWLGTMDQAGLYQLNMTTGVATRKVDFDGVDPSLSFSSTDLLEDTVGVAHQWPDHLIWEFDVCQEELVPLGPTGIGDMGGISFGPDGRLFGFSHGEDAIMEINPNTGNAVELYSLPFDAGKAGMAYDCSTETLYAVDADSDTLYTVDPYSGALMSSLPISQPLENRLGMEWDNASQSLILVADDVLYSVEPSTGDATPLSAISGLDQVNDLAFFPPCAP